MNKKVYALMEAVNQYDVRTSASPHALFMPKHSDKPGPIKYWISRDLAKPKGEITVIDQWFGFRIYCAPHDHPADPIYQSYKKPQGWWESAVSQPARLLPYYPLVYVSRPAVWLASVGWDGNNDSFDLSCLYLRTSTGKIDGRLPNRSVDIEWSLEKIKWLWAKALPSDPLPEIEVYTTYTDDERGKIIKEEQEYANSAEAAADITAYWLYGPGSDEAVKYGEAAFKALQACGPGWHSFEEIEEKLDEEFMDYQVLGTNYLELGLRRYYCFGWIEKGIVEDEMLPDTRTLTEIYRVIA
jgi:hypothetical protein